jgi:hypothetical protein
VSAFYGRSVQLRLGSCDPFAFFELTIIYRKDLIESLDAFKMDEDFDMGQATAEEVQRAAKAA